MPALLGALLAAAAATTAVDAAPGLQTPAMGWSNWNSFANNINASLFRETAAFMKESGLLAAGYTYVTLGGIGYANGSTSPAASKGHGHIKTNKVANQYRTELSNWYIYKNSKAGSPYT